MNRGSQVRGSDVIMLSAQQAAGTADIPMTRPRRTPPPPDVATQLMHVDAAWHLLSGKYPHQRVAALFGVSKSELYRWKDAALTYDLPEAEGLRRLYGHPSPAPSTLARMKQGKPKAD